LELPVELWQIKAFAKVIMRLRIVAADGARRLV
jgi:hypothetical protein